MYYMCYCMMLLSGKVADSFHFLSRSHVYDLDNLILRGDSLETARSKNVTFCFTRLSITYERDEDTTTLMYSTCDNFYPGLEDIS